MCIVVDFAFSKGLKSVAFCCIVLTRKGGVGIGKIMLGVPETNEGQLILKWAKVNKEAGESSCPTSQGPECGMASLGQDPVQRQWSGSGPVWSCPVGPQLWYRCTCVSCGAAQGISAISPLAFSTSPTACKGRDLELDQLSSSHCKSWKGDTLQAQIFQTSQ